MKKAKQSIKLILTTQLFLALSVLIGHAQTPESVDSLLHCIDEAIDTLPNTSAAKNSASDSCSNSSRKPKTYMPNTNSPIGYTKSTRPSSTTLPSSTSNAASRLPGRRASTQK